MNELFDSAVRSAGDLAGVFECDGETAYFYLYQMGDAVGEKVLEAIRIANGGEDLDEEDVSIIWDAQEQKVGLIIEGSLWAVFDIGSKEKYGGNYSANGTSGVPPHIASDFRITT